MNVLVATQDAIVVVDPETGGLRQPDRFPARRPTALAADPRVAGRAWCGTLGDGVLVTDDAGLNWRPAGLQGERIMTVAPSPADPDLVWVGVEPSGVWRSEDGGGTWRALRGLAELPSSAEWSFPPRPETHHVRWIACHPVRAGSLWVAIEAGALISTVDGGATWRDRVAGGPYDTHELAIHPRRPEALRVAAGDGYFESDDGGASWTSPEDGLEVGYLRSVAIDPGNPAVVIVSASTHAHSAYVAGRSDGRLYRRVAGEPWRRITEGWPEPPRTIAPLLAAGHASAELFAADERGVHRSADGGTRWQQTAAFATAPQHLRGIAVLPGHPRPMR